jgi:hypothetical protein
MGQPITVTVKPSSRPSVVRLETNRSLTGMGHHRYRSREDAGGDLLPDELARRLFDHGGVRSAHVYSNVVTLEVEPGADLDGLAQVVHDLFIHYREGVTPSIA